jgi:ribonuclease R
VAKSRRHGAHFPTKEQIVAFIRDNPSRVGKREIARAFNVTGAGRIPLKALLKELEAEGILVREAGRRLAPPGALPEIAVIEISGVDRDGEVYARPAEWEADTPPPKILVQYARKRGYAPGKGERVLARLRRESEGVYSAEVLRAVENAPARVIGVFERQGDGSGRVRPADRRNKAEYIIPARDVGNARKGDIVAVLPSSAPRLGPIRARVVDRIGREDDPRTISLIAAHTQGIPLEFPADAIAQAQACRPAPLDGRTDLRRVPLITIDGSDARDFDDAVFAEADPDHPGGWHLIVAIADVAWYVRPGDALDRSALQCGTSVYFPDRVIPMLPEALSNDLCSLRPREDRATLAAHIWIDAQGRIRRHRFERAMIRSAARLTYDQVQAARDGTPDDAAGPLMERVIAPLYGAYAVLAAARDKRGALDLDMPERKVEIGANGHISRIAPRQHFDSHKLIEEFMIAANVAAAETLEARHTPCMYRVHDVPDPAKVAALADFVAALGFRMAKGQVMTATQFNRLLAQARGTPHWELINDMILRTQSQAVYSPDNLGHFGLGLRRYSHFTSPIRRYADLLVHRGLIRALGLGEGGLPDSAEGAFEDLGVRISAMERRGMLAEREALDRYITAFMADHVNAEFQGRVTGVTRVGLFVTLDETGANGLVPIRSLEPRDFYFHDERHQRLVGERTGRYFSLGMRVAVQLIEANTLTGSLLFDLLEGGADQAADSHRSKRPPSRPKWPQRPPPRKRR